MKENDPLQEIREIREKHAAKHKYDLVSIAIDIEKDRENLAEQGWKLVKRKKLNKSWELTDVTAPRKFS